MSEQEAVEQILKANGFFKHYSRPASGDEPALECYINNDSEFRLHRGVTIDVFSGNKWGWGISQRGKSFDEALVLAFGETAAKLQEALIWLAQRD